ncbi:MAG: alpha/beta hydrolase [bacterium]|nr:alpha/beta hydrolase [bacterium]
MDLNIAIPLIALIGINIILHVAFPGVVYKTVMVIERGIACLVKKKVSIGSHDICYFDSGAGEPILLLHGFNGSKDNWIRFARYLTREYRVIAIDDPGFEESSKIPEESYSIKDQVKRINAFCEKLDLDKVHIVGNSMGGAIAGMFAATFPEKVITLGLFDAAGAETSLNSETFKEIAEGSNPLINHKPEDYERFLKFCFSKRPFITSPVVRYLGARNMLNASMNEKIFEDIKIDLTDLEQNLKKIKAPSLIIWGDKDRVLDISGMKVFEKGIARSTGVVFKNCGHVPMLERPRKTAKQYRQFINNEQ